MSQRKPNPGVSEQTVTTEADLQDKWGSHPSPFAQSVLKLRRGQIKRDAKLLMDDEINREVRRRRYGDRAA